MRSEKNLHQSQFGPEAEASKLSQKVNANAAAKPSAVHKWMAQVRDLKISKILNTIPASGEAGDYNLFLGGQDWGEI